MSSALTRSTITELRNPRRSTPEFRGDNYPETQRVAAFGIQVADAVHALHLAGIVHRDLKPHNIMVAVGADRATAKLIDLGLASVGAVFQDAQDARFTPDPPARHQTQLGHPIGTPPYLPPEAGQCPAEPRLDVYSLAATLYQLCTQVLPQATGVQAIREVCPGSDAPDDFSRLLQAALAADQNERLPSADHLRRGLEAILATHPPAGSRHLFGGCYDLLEVLGVGACAVAYRASDRELSREVAIKVLRDAKPSDDDVIRFRRAAKVLSALHHPNIPRIHHFGTHAGQRFAVTELCPGSPATNYVRPDNHLRPDEVIAVGLQLAGALAVVHAVGVIYRDLHPGNVLIARGDAPRAWIFDFDQAQVSPGFYASLTERWATPPEERQAPQHEKPLHTMDYAAPELRSGAAFSAASDVYALGFLLYRLLTGRRPFPVSGGEPTPPRKVCPACPPGFAALLLGMLSPRPEGRPALAAVLRTLDDEQAELVEPTDRGEDNKDAEWRQASDEQGVDRQPTVAAVVVDVEPDAELTVIADTEDPQPATAIPNTTINFASSGRPRRTGVALLVLVITAAVSLAVGRATVPRGGTLDPSDLVSHIAEERIEGFTTDERSTLLRRNTPIATTPTSKTVPPATDLPPPASSSTATVAKREGPSRPVRREAVSSNEAMTAAHGAVPHMRRCKDVPRNVTVGLDIIRGRGVVTSINEHDPAPDDPRYPWHVCVKQALERLRYPQSTVISRVQLRLAVR